MSHSIGAGSSGTLYFQQWILGLCCRHYVSQSGVYLIRLPPYSLSISKHDSVQKDCEWQQESTSGHWNSLWWTYHPWLNVLSLVCVMCFFMFHSELSLCDINSAGDRPIVACYTKHDKRICKVSPFIFSIPSVKVCTVLSASSFNVV